MACISTGFLRGLGLSTAPGRASLFFVRVEGQLGAKGGGREFLLGAIVFTVIDKGMFAQWFGLDPSSFASVNKQVDFELCDCTYIYHAPFL
jgi:hypothetical protein